MCVARRSIISSPAGIMPAAITCVTALPAASTLAKLAITTCAQAGLGMSLTVTSVTTPNMPSEPMNTDSRSRPGASGA